MEVDDYINEEDFNNEDDKDFVENNDEYLTEKSSELFSNNDSEDNSWVVRAKSGDQRAFAVLMSKYHVPMFNMLNRMLRNETNAEDLMMEVFAKAFKKLKFYDEDRSFSSWLFRIGTNTAIDFIRAQKRNIVSVDNDIETQDGEVNSLTWSDTLKELDGPEELLIRLQKRDYAMQVFQQLPTDYREVSILRYFEDKSYSEIAEQLSLPVGTVKVRLFRAREILQEKLKNIYNN